MYVRASSKGQIVLPAEIRRKYHLEQGTRLRLVDMGTHVSLFPVREDPVGEFFGMLRDGASLTRGLERERRRELEDEDGRRGER